MAVYIPHSIASRLASIMRLFLDIDNFGQSFWILIINISAFITSNYAYFILQSKHSVILKRYCK